MALDGARLAELAYPTGSIQILAWFFATSLVYALLASLIWPLFWGATLVAAVGSFTTVLYLLAVVVGPLAVGAIVGSVITVALYGLPGGPAPGSAKEPADRA